MTFSLQAAGHSFDNLRLELMMLPTDLALIEDPAFRPHVEAYADDPKLFFSDFSKVRDPRFFFYP